MSYRFMRIMVFFDLPTVRLSDRREYVKFRQHLIKSGFFMMQESVYCKIALNMTAAEAIRRNIRKNKPQSGLVQMITITEKQFSKMEFVVGESTTDVVNTIERLIVL